MVVLAGRSGSDRACELRTGAGAFCESGGQCRDLRPQLRWQPPLNEALPAAQRAAALPARLPAFASLAGSVRATPAVLARITNGMRDACDCNRGTHMRHPACVRRAPRVAALAGCNAYGGLMQVTSSHARWWCYTVTEGCNNPLLPARPPAQLLAPLNFYAAADGCLKPKRAWAARQESLFANPPRCTLSRTPA